MNKSLGCMSVVAIDVADDAVVTSVDAGVETVVVNVCCDGVGIIYGVVLCFIQIV